MSRLSKLLGKPKEIEINGEVFTFKPLTVKDIDLMMDLESEAKRANAMQKIITKTLKEACPEATEEEIAGVAVTHLEALTNAIMEVNGLIKDGNPQGKDGQTVSETTGK